MIDRREILYGTDYRVQLKQRSYVSERRDVFYRIIADRQAFYFFQLSKGCNIADFIAAHSEVGNIQFGKRGKIGYDVSVKV